MASHPLSLLLVEPALPGLLTDERTSPLQLQLTEQEKLHRKLNLKFSAQSACGKAEIDVKLQRVTGKDEELLPRQRCYYWREQPTRPTPSAGEDLQW